MVSEGICKTLKTLKAGEIKNKNMKKLKQKIHDRKYNKDEGRTTGTTSEGI